MDKDIIFARYYNLTLRYLSYRPRSEKEVVDYLSNKFKNQKLKIKIESQNQESVNDLIEKIISKLKEYKFIDDEVFLNFWFEQRIKYKRKPLKIVKYELIQKGISKDLIEAYFGMSEKSEELDLENAKLLAEKKKNFYRNFDSRKRREKIMNFLIRKGFSFDIVKNATKNI